MQQRLGIGIIGAGGIARERHLPGLRQLDGVEFVAVANRRFENAQRAAEEYGFARAVRDWREVVRDPEVDAVLICTPPYMHREMTEYALQNGKHVFCQARMAMNLEDARRMLEADRNTSLTTMLCPPPHYMKVEQRILGMIREGRLGEIRHVTVHHPTSLFADPQQKLHWRQRADLQGINMLDVGIMGEVLQKWFGQVDRVCATARTYVTKRPADGDGKSDVELPDSVQLIGTFAAASR